MPIAKRVSSPRDFVLPGFQPPKPKEITPPPVETPPVVFTERVKELLCGLPPIGHVEDLASLRLKYIVPNQNLWACFNGFWLSFIPAYGRARGAAQGHVKVLAILCNTMAVERSPDQQPVLRLSDPDESTWPALVKEWTDKLSRTGHTPTYPYKIGD